jgi:phage-related protein
MHGTKVMKEFHDFMIAVSAKLGAVEQTAKAAHTRMDDLQLEFKDSLKELSKDLKDLNAHMASSKGWGDKIETLTNNMHQSKGAKAVLVLFGSAIGAIASGLISHFLK